MSKKRAKKSNRYFTKEGVQMINKCVKKGLTLLMIIKIQIKTQ